jgi:hypothetical protein
MSRILVAMMILVFAALPAVLGADGEPEPFKSLAGTWVRPALGTDGKPIPASFQSIPGKVGPAVVPELRFGGNDDPALKQLGLVVGRWNLVVGAYPQCGSMSSSGDGSSYAVKVVPEKSKGVLVLAVGEGKSPWDYKVREVSLKYKIEKDTLTIECKESLAAGHYLGRYNISGMWVRSQAPAK